MKNKTQTTQPLMTTKSMVESAWADDMGQFLYHLDSDILYPRISKVGDLSRRRPEGSLSNSY